MCSTCNTIYCSKICQEIDHQNGKCYYVANIEKQTLNNKEKGPIIIYNDPSGRLQVGLMSINPGDKAEWETHVHLTQFIRVESGTGTLYLNENFKQQIGPGDAAIIPSNTKHMIQSGDAPLQLYTLYAKNTTNIWEH